MASILHLKLIVWVLLLGGLCYGYYRNKSKIDYNIRELRAKITENFRGGISLNGSFEDDLESGLSSINFDIRSQNSRDQRSGLDDESKEEIKKIMETENLSFDKARLLFTERKFSKNDIAPDGTPMDPKAVTFIK